MMLVKFNRSPVISQLDEIFGQSFQSSCCDDDTISKSFKVDIYEDENAVYVEADLEGIKKEDIDVAIEDDVLTIKAERKEDREEDTKKYYRRERVFGSLSRQFSLGDNINADSIDAKFQEGVLHITIDKIKQSTSMKKVEIK